MLFDSEVIVVGGGHAGAEAALASARMGISTLLITARIDSVATMPCNPSIGGLAKSHLVYELDALGGEMGKNADATALQAKTLNSSRGPAVQATRAQCAKQEYAERMQKVIAAQPNLTVLEDAVIGLCTEPSSSVRNPYESTAIPDPSPTANTKAAAHDNSYTLSGIITEHYGAIAAKAVVLTAGTTLRGRIWIGKECQESGGDGRPAVNLLSECLSKLGFSLIRLKTGTPPRLKASSCNFAACQRQDGENPRPLFHVEHSEESLLTQRREDAELSLGRCPRPPSAEGSLTSLSAHSATLRLCVETSPLNLKNRLMSVRAMGGQRRPRYDSIQPFSASHVATTLSALRRKYRSIGEMSFFFNGLCCVRYIGLKLPCVILTSRFPARSTARHTAHSLGNHMP